jgi:hypothetical protein
MADADNEVIGISDTWHGEDHCWADHFTRVIDVNSTSPFPPLVVADSPLREIHSAQLLTQHERERRADGAQDYQDPRRAERLSPPSGGEHVAATLATALAGVAAEVEALGAQHHNLVLAGAGTDAAQSDELEVLLAKLEEAVGSYNEASPGVRRSHLAAINQLALSHRRLLRRRVRSQRAVSKVSLGFAHRLSAARATLEATA